MDAVGVGFGIVWLLMMLVIVLAGSLGALIYLLARRPTRKQQFGQ